ncbi:DegT/DnrJ/EryC1/StrS family aminotransferase [Halomonas denitrificans]|uniref:DegT/DnrJ/EryC1/StrS family aminotransferase n=1 Tax=Halomonas denitrificans TaxID=370769 RepID=UPI000D38613D|nr:DegT/DnrJ/EryC1/StrS aminotransferase family protein [Halomonas denitrificans]
MGSWPCFEEDELEAVSRVLRSGWVNYWSGEEGVSFEREFAAFHDVPHAIALANGSVALELALYALGVGPGDEVVVTPRSFMASVSCVVARGAQPVFADVDPDSGNLTAESVRAVLTPRTRAIIAVHLAGWPCDLDALRTLADQCGLWLIEDCAQAHGATWRGRLVGSIGDAAAFSFCTDKIISTGGEGGMLLLRDKETWRRAWSYKDHGKSWEAVHSEHALGFRWLHESFGTNWRLTEMQSAIGRVQLRKLPAWKRARRANAERIWATARTCPGLRAPEPPSHIEHAAYKAYVFVEPERLRPGWDRDRILAEIVAAGVVCLVGSCSEIYREKAFLGSGWVPKRSLPVAKHLGEVALMFLCDPTLTEAELELNCQVMKEVMQRAAR